MKRKNKISFLILLFILSLFTVLLTSCGKTVIVKGEQGDNGIDGVDGKDGKNGLDGVKGDDAKNIELSVDDAKGIMWRYEGDKAWNVLMTFDDLIHYNQKYSIKLNTDYGLIEEAVYKELNNLKYNQSVSLPHPSCNEYTFLGWFDENNEEVPYKFNATENLNLTAKWCVRAFLQNCDDATNEPLVKITDDLGNPLTDDVIASEIKDKFLDEYCIASNYDEEKTLQVKALTGVDLYNEMVVCFTPNNAFYTFDGDVVKLTAFGRNWTWLLDYIGTRYVRHSNIKVAEVLAWTYVARSDPRTQWMISFLEEGAIVAGEGSYNELEAIKKGEGHPINFMAMHFTNFFEADDSQYAPGTSVDKVIPFKISETDYRYAYNDSSREEITYYVYSDLYEALCPVLDSVVDFNIGEAYKLPNILKDGYTFAGWYLDEAFTSPITELNDSHNEALIYAKFVEKDGE